MKNKIFVFCIFFLFPLQISAIYDPLGVPNNKYGIHVMDILNLEDVPPLVNSSEGDWGYITIVIHENDRDVQKWQNVFDLLRKNHIIPIMRLATYGKRDSWVIPKESAYHEWIDFLNKLNWVTKNRYIVLFNEPNHSYEWGGMLDPKGYGKMLVTFGKMLKKSNEDYFILPAGFDASASSNNTDMNIEEFLERMVSAYPEALEIIDGWTSHSYPNPGFSGSPNSSGKGTIRSYEWELSLLRSLGLQKKLPVFITETGWKHSMGRQYMSNLMSPEDIAQNIRIASLSVWTDPQIVAITPFVLNSQDPPFDHFSWISIGYGYYPQYDVYKNIKKISGKPLQNHSVNLLDDPIPDTLVTNSSYEFNLKIENSGQSIISYQNGFKIFVDDKQGNFSSTITKSNEIYPFTKGELNFILTTPKDKGSYPIDLVLAIGNTELFRKHVIVNLIPPPSVSLKTSIGWKKENSDKHLKLIIYDDKNSIVHEFKDMEITDGTIYLQELHNIVIGKTYRFVAILPYYLPRQTIHTISERDSIIKMKQLLPFDFTNDGAFTIDDIWTMLCIKPRQVVQRFL